MCYAVAYCRLGALSSFLASYASRASSRNSTICQLMARCSISATALRRVSRSGGNLVGQAINSLDAVLGRPPRSWPLPASALLFCVP